jgi:hypothetical protein
VALLREPVNPPRRRRSHSSLALRALWQVGPQTTLPGCAGRFLNSGHSWQTLRRSLSSPQLQVWASPQLVANLWSPRNPLAAAPRSRSGSMSADGMSELELARQAETSSKRMVQDQQAGAPART